MGLDIKSQRQCIYCHNFCKFSCPSYVASKDQKVLQTQRNYLIYLYNKGKLKLDKEFGRSVYLCNDCKRCERYCLYDDKDVLNNNRYSKELIFRNGLAPKKIYEIEENLREYGNIFGIDTRKDEENSKDLFGEYDVYVYLGDYVKYLEPQIFSSFKKILNLLNIRYVFDENEVSDGEVALNLGMLDLAKELMKYNLERISKYNFKKMVVLSPGSYCGFKVDYKNFGYEIKSDIVHYTEFINNYISSINVNRVNDNIKYHDPCKLGRYLGIFKEPRNILKKLFNVEDFNFFRNKDESKCCGGYISLYDEEISKRISLELIRECEESGSNVLITSCPTCLNNLKKVNLDRKIKIFDVLEYIALNLKK